MRTTIDLTDEVSPDVARMPDPSTIWEDGNEVVVQLREVEIRMDFRQLIGLREAFGRWIFRGRRDAIDIEDPLYIEAQEHEKLRDIVRQMLDGEIGGVVDDVGTVGHVEVPERLRKAVRWALAEHELEPEQWVSRELRLGRAESEVVELRAEIAKLRGKPLVSS